MGTFEDLHFLETWIADLSSPPCKLATVDSATTRCVHNYLVLSSSEHDSHEVGLEKGAVVKLERVFDFELQDAMTKLGRS
jgi:hypothetical protein